jgi:hypothetical protein
MKYSMETNHSERRQWQQNCPLFWRERSNAQWPLLEKQILAAAIEVTMI